MERGGEVFEKIKQRRHEKWEKKFDPKVAEELYEKVKRISSPQEARQVHREMKANGMDGLPIPERYPYVPSILSGIALAVAIICKITR